MNKISYYVPVYTFTLILSAALLFSVQPMFSKMILPLLGGTSQVWNTSMLFFQLCLLAGYAYAHGTTKFLNRKTQAIIHLVLLLGFFSILPFAIPDNTIPPFEKDPTYWQIGLMLTTIGGPFFLVSSTAPMLQAWFTHSDHKDAHNPYFLYSASNLGSVCALLAYPTILEPLMSLSAQSSFWTYGYAVLFISIILCAALVWRSFTLNDDAQSLDDTNKSEETDLTWSLRGKWLALAFIPSSLMLGVTTYITTDIASAPLFWILPLTLYILTFVIVFARKQIIKNETSIFMSCLLIMALIVVSIAFKSLHFNPSVIISLHLATFFFTALACHGSLTRIRPTKSHLTEFYLFMSAGGALGGFFNAIIAPQTLSIPLEYPLVLGLATYVFYIGHGKAAFTGWMHKLTFPSFITSKENAFYIAAILLSAGITAHFFPHKGFQYSIAAICLLCLLTCMSARKTFAFCATILLAFPSVASYQNLLDKNNNLVVERNFFGVKRITENAHVRTLFHGTTQHGSQPVSAELKLVKTGYYAELTPYNDVFGALNNLDREHNVAVLGLGIGTLACFTHPKRTYDFYEIDIDVIKMAENTEYFTYLSGCGSAYENFLGDGRIEIEKQPNKKYKMVIADAFSSDNIPVHLITLDAVKIYLEKLEDDGILVFHISNRFLNLEPVMHSIGKELDLTTLKRFKLEWGEIEGTALKSYPTQLLIMTKNDEHISFFKQSGWEATHAPEGFRVWRDDYSNILSVLNGVSFKKH